MQPCSLVDKVVLHSTSAHIGGIFICTLTWYESVSSCYIPAQRIIVCTLTGYENVSSCYIPAQLIFVCTLTWYESVSSCYIPAQRIFVCTLSGYENVSSCYIPAQRIFVCTLTWYESVKHEDPHAVCHVKLRVAPYLTPPPFQLKIVSNILTYISFIPAENSIECPYIYIPPIQLRIAVRLVSNILKYIFPLSS